MRDSSPDRRVYTSPLGHAVPPEFIGELSRKLRSALKKKQPEGGASDGEDEPAPGEPLGEEPEKTAKTEKRTAKATLLRRPASLFHDVAHSLLWAVLLSTLGGAVAWGVYLGLRHAAPAAGSGQPYPSSTAASGPAGLTKAGRAKSWAAGESRSRLPPRSGPGTPLDERPPERPALIVPVAPPGASVVAPPVAAEEPKTAAPPLRQSAVPGQPTPPSGSHDDIDFVASAHSPQVRACYDRAFRNAGSAAPAGRVELSFTLTDTGDAGRAADIVTELNLLGNPAVATCLEELVAEWRFPRPPPAPPGGPARLRYPFVFTPAGP